MKIVVYGVASTTKEVLLMRREKKLPHKCRFGPIGHFWRRRIVNFGDRGRGFPAKLRTVANSSTGSTGFAR
jgi:hypothetical protein